MRLSRLLVLAIVALVPLTAQATSIVGPHSGGWEYTFVDPTGSPNWNTKTNDGSGSDWLVGSAPFGNHRDGADGHDAAKYFDWQTYWACDWESDGPNGDDLWVRRAVNLSGYDLDSVGWHLGVDNGYTLYVNGHLVASDNAEGFTSRWEYSGLLDSGILNPGMNVIAVALEDHGHWTAFDMEVTGTPVPEPATLTLVALGLLVARASRPRP